MILENFLQKKPIFYAKIDYTRMPKVYSSIKSKLNLSPIIHIVGTNGKGSIGRFLAQILQTNSKNTAHYTSPHISKFNERLWKNGEILSDEILDNSHLKLQKILTKEQSSSLSFFEYLTLIAGICFEDCDEIVCEAGLGGEYDATNIYPKKLSIITPIGYDHEKLLGNSLENIITTKLKSIQTTALLAEQPYELTYKIAKQIADEKGVSLLRVDELLDSNDISEIDDYINKYKYPNFLKSNLKVAFAAAKTLGYDANLDKLKELSIKGRFEKLAPNLTLDVGHNPLAATAVTKSLQDKSIILIYNTFEDKDYKKVLEIFKPKLKEVKIISFDSKGRATNKRALEETLANLKIPFSDFDFTLRDDEKYVVFGSFFVAEEFLKWYNER